MKILFICNIIDDKRQKICKGYQAAALLWQHNILKGFESIPNVSVDLLSAPLIPQFSRTYQKIFSKGYTWSHSSTSVDRCVSFINIFPIRNIFMQISFSYYVREWIRRNRKENICIISYSPRIPFIQPLNLAKRLKVLNCAIIPDLPEYSGISRMREPIYRYLKKIDIILFYKYSKNIDSFVLFSKHMKEHFPYEIKHIVIECISDSRYPTKNTRVFEEDENIKRIVYTGGLEYEYGILLLLSAFRKIPGKNYRLDICGSGSAAKKIIEESSKDDRIKYHGLVSHEIAKMLQGKATILVNPRMPKGEFTKYSFPSKNVEYMLSGKPVLCFKLEGIPDEYDDYLIYFKTKQVEEVAKKMISICELDETNRNLIGLKSREFICNSKNYTIQAKKILTLLGCGDTKING